MADEDEVDIIGDFSFNSCFAQNDQGIPSCSSREDTVHPQWLLDSTVSNWYDRGSKEKHRNAVQLRKLIGNNTANKLRKKCIDWSKSERDILKTELKIHGRNMDKLSEVLKTKSRDEIQTFLDTEYELDQDVPVLEKKDVSNIIPSICQKEVFYEDATNMNNILNMVSTGTPTITTNKKAPFKKKTNVKSQNSLLKPDNFNNSDLQIDTSEIYYEDDLIIGSTECVGSETDLTDVVLKNIVKYQAKVKAEKKIGNHRRKVSRNYDKKVRNRSKDFLKSPQRRQRKDSSLSDDSVKSPKMQIVLGSGQALPVSEGEQVIKIEKKKDSEPESDIDIDVDSDNEDNKKKAVEEIDVTKESVEEGPIAVPLRKFEPMPRRPKKINLDGGGGYTIMHTESGDLYEVASEPRRERQPRKQPIELIQCRVYNAEKPAPYELRLHVSALIAMDAHAHTSRGEVMGLVGGRSAAAASLALCLYRPAAAAAGGTHCDMDPVSQAAAAESVRRAGGGVCGWHHSHPQFPSAPSALDLRTQRALQRAFRGAALPFLSLITSQHWPTGRTASQYRCIRVEDEDLDTDIPIGYQFSVKLVPDLTLDNLEAFQQELMQVTQETTRNDLSINMARDVCPQAGITYLEKCISSVRHHMRSAGYADDDPVVAQLVHGIRDIFR